VPLVEEELLDCQLVVERCVFIKVSYIDQIRSSLEKGGHLDVDYKTVVIESANPEMGEYNFFEALTTGWFGYRSCSQGTFRTFNGTANELQIGTSTTDLKIVSDVEMEVRTCGFGSVAKCFQPEMLCEFFGYDVPTRRDIDRFPPCYIRNAFHFRNNLGDEMPEDPMLHMLGQSTEMGSPPRRSHCDSPIRSRATGPATGLSPSRRRMRPDDAPSPLTPRSGNSQGKDEDEPPVKRRRARASPSNNARYPRPPDEVNSFDTALQWTAYARARGLGAAGASRRVVQDDEDEEGGAARFIDTEADGEDAEKVNLPVHLHINLHILTLSYPCPHFHRRLRSRRRRRLRTVRSSTTRTRTPTTRRVTTT